MNLKSTAISLLAVSLVTGCVSTDKSDRVSYLLDNPTTTSDLLLDENHGEMTHIAAIGTTTKVKGVNHFDNLYQNSLLVNSSPTIAQTLQIFSALIGTISLGEGAIHTVGIESSKSKVDFSYQNISLVKFTKVDNLDFESVNRALQNSTADLISSVTDAYNSVGIEVDFIGDSTNVSTKKTFIPHKKGEDLIYACAKDEYPSKLRNLSPKEIKYDNGSCSLHFYPYHELIVNDLQLTKAPFQGAFTTTKIFLPVTFPVSQLKSNQDMYVVIPQEELLVDNSSYKFLLGLDDKERNMYVDSEVFSPNPRILDLTNLQYLKPIE